MKNTQLIHQALKQIDFTFVMDCFDRLNLHWYEDKRPSKKEVIDDLLDLIQFACEKQKNTQVLSEHWLVGYYDVKAPFLEIVFTPIVITSEQEKELRIKKLKDRLKKAEKTENYELAQTIQRTINKIERN